MIIAHGGGMGHQLMQSRTMALETPQCALWRFLNSDGQIQPPMERRLIHSPRDGSVLIVLAEHYPRDRMIDVA